MSKSTALTLDMINLLALQAKHGDDHAFNMLYTHFFIPMKRFAFVRVNDTMLAEDLVQNVWLKISKRIKTLDDITLFRSWLFKALKWEISDWVKSSKNKILANSAHEDASDSQVADQALDMGQLMPILAGLPASEADVVELHYLNGLSVQETALALDVPEGTVKSRLSRARETLRTSIYEESNYEL